MTYIQGLTARLLGCFAALALSATSAWAVEAVWVGGPSGLWSEPTNWSTGVVPNVATTNATVDDNTSQDSVVVLDQNATIGNLLVEAGDTLNFDPSRVLTANAATIAGDINLAASSRLQVSDSVWVQSDGILSLADVSSQVSGFNAPYLLRNEGLIEGAGTFFNPVLNNEGTVKANVTGKQLLINPFATESRGLHVNRGELIAENGGALNVVSESVRFTPLENATGLIEARGDSTALLRRIRLVGGLVSTSSAGGAQEGAVTLSFSLLENVTLERNVKLDSVTFSGRAINNTRLEETAANTFFVEGYATISGEGWLELNNGTFNAPVQIGPYLTPGLINDVNHTIKGPGVINPSTATERIAFENRGTIETDEGTLQINLRSTNQFTYPAAPSTNAGTIRAKTGGRVEILGSNATFGDTLTNSAGTTMGVIEAGVDSTIALGNMTLRGGILRAVAAEEGSGAQSGKVTSTRTTTPALEDVRLEGTIGDTNSGWILAGTIENTGVLTGAMVIAKPTTLTGGGEISLPFGGGLGGLGTQFDGFFDPLINEDNLIHGAGGIGGNIAFTNRAIVQADIPNGAISISKPGGLGSLKPQPFFNSGEFKAINGGKLTITAEIVNFEGSDLGTIHAGNGSEVQVAEVSGGILSTEGSGKIIFAGNSERALVNVHNLGSLVIGNGTALFRGKTVNDGTVTQTAATQVNFGGPFAELTGNGMWGTSNIALAFVVGASSAPSIFTHGAEHTIQGGGTIGVANGAFINRGTVIANGTTPLRITAAQGTTIQQRGSLIVNSSRTMEVQINDELFVNRGIVNATGTFQLKRMNPGTVEFRNAPGAELHVGSVFSVMLPNSNGFMVSLWNQEGALMTGNGKVNLYRNLANHETLFRNSGTLRPERDSTRFGEIFVSGNFQQDATGLLEIELGGSSATSNFDALHITEGRAFLGGTLDISLLDTYDPAIGDSFEIVTNIGGMVMGTFDVFNAPELSGRWWSLNYQSDKVVLAVNAITADFNVDGFVDGLDLSTWQFAYEAGNSAADADGDGDSDGRDFLDWQRQYGAGIALNQITATEVVSPVPEPEGMALVFVGILVIGACRPGVKSHSVQDKVAASVRNLGLPVTLAMLVSFCTCRKAFSVEDFWIGGPSGTWSDGANWSTGIVPNLATTNVTIDDDSSQDRAVVLDQNATIQNLVVDAGDALNLDPNRILTANSVTIGGEIGLAAGSQLKASDFIWIEPDAIFSLADGAQIIRTGNAQYVPIMNQGRIEGAGGLLVNDYRFALNNEGAIVANVPGKPLQIRLFGTNSRGLHLNSGELIAENGGELRIFGPGNTSNQAFFTPLDNSTGVIEARGDSKITMSTVRLIGGKLITSSAGGSSEGLLTFTSVLFENVTLEGNIALNSVTFGDHVINNTRMEESSPNDFFMEGYVTISGDGWLDLNGGIMDIPGGSYGGILVGTPGFVNDVNHTIKGPGRINAGAFGSNRLAIDNRGLIECDNTSPFLNPDTLQINLRSASSTSGGSSINSGTIRAKSGGRIEILGTSLNDELANFSGAKLGLVEAGVGSTVTLGMMTLRGGVLRAVGADGESSAQSGKVITTTASSSSATLENLRLEGTIGDTVSNSRWNLAGNIENTGVLTGQIAIAKSTTLTGGGEVRLEEGGGIKRIEPVNGTSIPLVNENNLIHGAGDFGTGLAFTNRAVVQADVANGTLDLYPSYSDPPPLAFNSGLFTATDGGKLVVKAQVVNYEGSDLGTIHAGEGSEVQVTQVIGGILSTDGSGRIVVVYGGTPLNGPYLTEVHNQGTLVIDANARFHGRIVNDGTITQNDLSTAFFGTPFTELTGAGVWGMPTSNLAIEVGMPTGAQFVHGAQHTIQGGGTINVANGVFINEGTLIPETSQLTIDLLGGASMVQQGTFFIQGGQEMEVVTRSPTFNNKGYIEATGEMTFRRGDTGSLEVVNEGGASISLRGALHLEVPDVAGAQTVLWNKEGASLTGKGSIDFSVGGQITGLFRNSGYIRPEGEFAELGRLYLDGDFVQDATGTLEMNVAGIEPGEFDALILEGSDATLGGTLNIFPLATFDPPVGQAYTIIDTQGGTVSGGFDTFSAPALAGRWWLLNYLTDKVVLSVEPITADFNLDGLVNGDDLLDWQSAFALGDNGADADGDGDSDGRDFLAWQRQYGSGVAVGGLSVAVPEPRSWVLLLCVFFISSSRWSFVSFERW